MTKSELIAAIAARFPQLTANDASDAVNAILSAISARLASPGGRVEVRGFGSFSVHIRPPRRGRNPKTGEQVFVPQKAVPHFKAGVELRARVNGDKEMDETVIKVGTEEEFFARGRRLAKLADQGKQLPRERILIFEKL